MRSAQTEDRRGYQKIREFERGTPQCVADTPNCDGPIRRGAGAVLAVRQIRSRKAFAVARAIRARSGPARGSRITETKGHHRTTTPPDRDGDDWEDAVNALADDLLRKAGRFARSFPPQPHLRPVLIRQALARADEMVAGRLAEGRVSLPDNP
jgi:hypothetical protein